MGQQVLEGKPVEPPDPASLSFDLYNRRRYDEVLAFYADEIAFVTPPLLPAEGRLLVSGAGKPAFRERLRLFRDVIGPLTVDHVFSAKGMLSVTTRSDLGELLTFVAERDETLAISRIAVFQVPKRGDRHGRA